MKLGDIIREYREAHDLSQRQFANLCGLSNGYISMLEKGVNPGTGRPLTPTLPQLNKLAGGMKMSLSELFEVADDMPVDISSNILPLPKMKRWKVLGGTACGQPIFKELENESVLAPADIDADYVFRCVGDSMINARIFDGDVVFVKSGEYVEDGQIAVVRIGEEYTLKRIYRRPDCLELRAENPMYPVQIVRGDQENAEIVGKAVQFLSRVI